MVCIIHGFPNSVSALRFEWAWQNPEKSRRLRALNLKKDRKESAFAFRLRIACHMLNCEPWRRIALTFRWLLPVKSFPCITWTFTFHLLHFTAVDSSDYLVLKILNGTVCVCLRSI